MSETIIQVENLSKKYIIGHQPQERYVALRDVLTNGIKSLGQRLRPSKQQVPDPCHEEFWALQDVSFEVKRGDRIGIIGRNGAGKSTLLKILSRITEPTRGRIAIKGRVASLLEVGTGFHPELTGRENIYLNGAILGMSRAEIGRKFDEIVAFAEVEKFLDTPVKRYSSGMYVRLAFAVAAHLEPEILIVDEVLAVGDAQFQKKCLGKMEDVGKEGRTVLFVSHNIEAIKTLCTRGLLLEKGIIKLQEDVYTAVDLYSQLNLNSGINHIANIPLTSSLLLESFTYKIFSNELEFSLKIRSHKEDSYILSAVILLYTITGVRLALIDIGNKQQTKIPLYANQTINYFGKVRDLNLIPGNYKLGFAIQTTSGWIDRYQILDVLIEESINQNSTIFKYPSTVRGIINLKYDVEMSII
ncbi:ABC transporter ATP-binding protein [Tumidithrix elongata RA019]|uniref:ABC transporter ATP-binding protein n=1 Tax=Tumidithrix elongata BACA0141 TaxID=2716417 RepID=A0AAW9PW84_9CYAN|nr:ABC transporter ATP-binding protein [Tumidithrix elongata RA019]